jgi:hypothetical protein
VCAFFVIDLSGHFWLSSFWKKYRTEYDFAKATTVLMETSSTLSVVDASMPSILKISKLEMKINTVPATTCVNASSKFLFISITAEAFNAASVVKHI